MHPHFFNCHYCLLSLAQFFSLFTLTFSLFFYEALQRPEQFVGHVSGILGNVESRARVYRSEVRVVGAIVAAGDCDVKLNKVVTKTMAKKGFKISQYVCAVLLIASSIALVAYQVIHIDDVAAGLLYYVAQSFLLAGSIFGLDQYIRIIKKRYQDGK